jgi:hypothetical protein
MKVTTGLKNPAAVLLAVLLAASGLLSGCLDNLCTKRLYLYRDAEPKSLPPAEMALLIADPAIVAAVLPDAAPRLPRGLPWAPEQPSYAQDHYRLCIDGLDDRAIFQGWCMNTTLTDVCEVRPGSRRVMGRLQLFGPWGQQSAKDTAAMTLEPGGVYFLYPDWQAAEDKTLRLKAERLPASYDAQMRSRLLDWLRRHTQGRSLEN